MIEKLIQEIKYDMEFCLNQQQMTVLNKVLLKHFKNIEISKKNKFKDFEFDLNQNMDLLNVFLSSKRVEGCSEKTLKYYDKTIKHMLNSINKRLDYITTDDLRNYLGNYRSNRLISKTTADNIRRILSSFFSWLEDEDYIIKNPVRRIKKIKKGRVVKDVLSDEHLELLRDNCDDIRDLAILELLISTGIRVGELVNLNIDDVNFNERECVVFGKGESEREVYFDAKTKIHLMNYLRTRNDNNPALFVSLKKPYTRLGISGVERRLRELGQKSKITKVHPHKFRRTLATNAIDKGMPIEQVQRLLGHVQIDTTMQYAMVNQNNVKLSHKKFIS
ncbi:site-specific tyrosine recombinase/integron integrase [Methanobrevibacter woesei]|uniref:site-specific tyrosine recombinase/integron integrase n=1 Tax=Methanobrevibacter woesei TaxID=190976 RepID=UPI0023F06A55|nr:site-specific tyrosine recombinase/integron integrase [Methanobrevibacter woesei]